jgi:hypothetical protein
MRKPKHGGKRKGSGRKPGPKTKTIRVPADLVDDFKTISKHHPKKWHYVLE